MRWTEKEEHKKTRRLPYLQKVRQNGFGAYFMRGQSRCMPSCRQQLSGALIELSLERRFNVHFSEYFGT
jgi:hypothetical protein